VKKDFRKRLLELIGKKVVRSRGQNNDQPSEAAILNIEKKPDNPEADLVEVIEKEEAKSAEDDAARNEAIPGPQEAKGRVPPELALVCIGEYPAKIIEKGNLPNSRDKVQPVFIDKSSDEEIKWGKDVLDAEKITGLDANVDTQFWSQVDHYLTENDELINRIRTKLEGNKFGVLMVSSLWDGIGSAVTPILISKLAEWNINTITIALSPSRLQPSLAHFNALSSIGMCLAKKPAALILLGRDQLNKYAGVDRIGSVLKGNFVLNSIVEMMLTKTIFVRELSEISRSLDVKVFTILAATGASLKMYGSLENILRSTTFRPLQVFDLSSASLLYVLIRLPNHLKEKLTRDKIELIIADWFKDKAVLKAVYVTEPLYLEDVTDRVDLLIFVGGFDLADTLETMKKKAEAVKTQAVKHGSIEEEEWKAIMKSLA